MQRTLREARGREPLAAGFEHHRRGCPVQQERAEQETKPESHGGLGAHDKRAEPHLREMIKRQGLTELTGAASPRNRGKRLRLTYPRGRGETEGGPESAHETRSPHPEAWRAKEDPRPAKRVQKWPVLHSICRGIWTIKPFTSRQTSVTKDHLSYKTNQGVRSWHGDT